MHPHMRTCELPLSASQIPMLVLYGQCTRGRSHHHRVATQVDGEHGGTRSTARRKFARARPGSSRLFRARVARVPFAHARSIGRWRRSATTSARAAAQRDVAWRRGRRSRVPSCDARGGRRAEGGATSREQCAKRKATWNWCWYIRREIGRVLAACEYTESRWGGVLAGR